jgi:uncharacterized protein YihD (DUF1040 family)
MIKKTRDPSRIELVLNALREYWNENPDLRLGQILENISSRSSKPTFYLEDDILLEHLNSSLEKKLAANK